MTYNPWAELASLPGIRVVFGALDDGCWGYYDEPTDTIHLDNRLSQTERRCTLAHELVHAKVRDVPYPDERTERHRERRVCDEATRRLVPLDALADMLAWADDEHVVAEALWVDVDTVRTRLTNLTQDELAYIRERQDNHLGSIA